MQHRHYGSQQGQWTAVDPLWPDQLPYGYVNGSPVTWSAPAGTLSLACTLACGGGLLCAGEILAACRNYSGFKNFADCAWQTFKNLPLWLQIACGVSAVGWIACLAPEL